ncbi:MAG: hypothetical protein Q4C54_07810 [Clostridia bacterium]|nr:hypothetical protein [Clostridia bacterium]
MLQRIRRSMKEHPAGWMIGLITLLGFVLRVIHAFWGFPLLLLGDEVAIVDNALDLVERGSYLSYVYNRPDQFEIKCCALIFAIARWIASLCGTTLAQWHYHLMARLYTVCFGTALIPMTGILAGKMVRRDSISPRVTACMASFLMAFCVLFV